MREVDGAEQASGPTTPSFWNPWKVETRAGGFRDGRKTNVLTLQTTVLGHFATPRGRRPH